MRYRGRCVYQRLLAVVCNGQVVLLVLHNALASSHPHQAKELQESFPTAVRDAVVTAVLGDLGSVFVLQTQRELLQLRLVLKSVNAKLHLKLACAGVKVINAGAAQHQAVLADYLHRAEAGVGSVVCHQFYGIRSRS